VTTIADVPAPTTIVFGTDGWRARVADDFTFENVRRCADGVARYVVERGEQAKGVVIAFDRRFASEHFAAAAAEVLLAHDIPVFLAASAVPTQMSSYEVVERGAAAGIVITASHNPWTDNGFKVKSPTGAAAGPEILAVLEAAGDFDVIHSHIDYCSFAFARLSKTPTVSTMHGRLDLEDIKPVYHRYRSVPLVSISDAQRTPLAFMNWVSTV
jgi:phosphoglucomutase